MYRLLAAGLLAFSIEAYAEPEKNIDCTNAFSTQDIEQCASISLENTEKELNLTYKKLVNSLSQPNTEYDNYTEYRRHLLTAQRAWIKFREADCAAQYEMHRSGTIRNSIYLACKEERAKQRIKELTNYAPY
ncbi:lysozyme inhibitor LprI family protein [Pseudomonas sp. SG20056]|uniref:lysozyme inhibitor LprI family protein n=1 Tax=Pseudomonas sp. SG20056 TaxID=3074146 RepID=UPI0038F7BEBE